MTSKKNEVTEFDEHGGFAVVDEFFKNSTSSNGKNAQAEQSQPDTKLQLLPTTHPSRRGVGATDRNSETKNTAIVSSVLTQGQRILQVGKRNKRQRDDDDDDDGDDEDDDDTRRGAFEDEDEEDIGRTGIIKDTSSATSKTDHPLLPLHQQSVATSTKKKKLGKKERQQQQAVDETITAESNDSVVANNVDGIQHEDDSEAKETTEADDTTSNLSNNTKKKKYRKKIRSKQKNIRKDHRDVKPLHLITKLRPLTAETRAKLQVPKIVPS
jgi:hypothetical protein